MGRGGRLLTFREAPSLLFACWVASTRGTKRWFCCFPKGWAHHRPQQHPPRRQRRTFGLDLRIFLSLVITAFGNRWFPGWLHKLPGMSPPLRVPSCVVAEFSSYGHQLHNPAPIFQPTEKQSVSSWLTEVANVTCGKSRTTQLPLPHWLTALLPRLWGAAQATSYVWSKGCASTFSIKWTHAQGGMWETSWRPPSSSLTASAQSPWKKAQGSTRLPALPLSWFAILTMPRWARFCL